jgi:hypothetical protein
MVDSAPLSRRMLVAWRKEALRQQYKRQRLKWAGVVRQTLLEKRDAAKHLPSCVFTP